MYLRNSLHACTYVCMYVCDTMCVCILYLPVYLHLCVCVFFIYIHAYLQLSDDLHLVSIWSEVCVYSSTVNHRKYFKIPSNFCFCLVVCMHLCYFQCTGMYITCHQMNISFPLSSLLYKSMYVSTLIISQADHLKRCVTA